MHTAVGAQFTAGEIPGGVMLARLRKIFLNPIPWTRGNLLRRRGAIILITATLILTLTASVALVYVRFALNEYRGVSTAGNREKSLQLAQSGLETGILLLTRIPLDSLYEFGIFTIAPTIPLGGGTVSLSISEESGKFNVNRLVRMFEDQTDEKQLEYFQRLSVALGIPVDLWHAVIDYVDENNTPMPRGAERDEYERLIPPRRIKNGRMQALEELLFIPGFDSRLLYDDLRSLDRIKNTSTASLSDAEKAAITPADYILANNITTYLVYNADTSTDLININSAPYHVILALSEFMTPVAARKIVTERVKRGGRFKSIADLATLPELQITTTGSLTLFKELSIRITDQNQIYKIVADASIDSQVAQVMGVLDPNAKRLVFYSE
ncbi:MAG: general secretion pathway protein GspK [Spirochaetes bacterium]|nr:general secretion pathway protein GspK [Spirochaetota bacterium]